MKRYLMFFLITLSFFFYSLALVYADDFYITEDYEDSEVYVTTLFSIESFPDDQEKIYTIEFDMDSVVGQKTELLEGNILWDEHVSVVGDRYRRIRGVNDLVRIPGGSRVGVFAIVKNESGHEVTLKDWMFYITRRNVVMGDLRVFGVEGTFGYDYYNFFGYNIFKTGHFIPSPLILNIEKDETKSFKLTSFEIFQPLKIDYFDWKPSILENGDLVADVSLKLKNIASFRLANVEYSHGNFVHTKTFSAGDEYTYEYQINYGKNYSPGLNVFDSFKIKKPTYKTESIVLGSDELLPISSDTKTLLYNRSDVNGSEDWFARSVDLDWYPRGGAMNVTLMPYSLVGKPLEYYVPPEIELSFSNDGGELGIGEDLKVQIEVFNAGMDLNSLVFELNFDNSVQVLKESDCDFLNFSEGLLINAGVLNSQEVFSCEVVFEILEKESFLILKNTLVFEKEAFDILTFKYIPDVEISLEYDYQLQEFVFETNVEDISSLLISENFYGELKCKKVSFLGLEDEVCI